MEPISFKSSKKQGIKAKAQDIRSNYSPSTLKKRDIMDSVAGGFDSNLAAELLGELTGGRDPFCGKSILKLTRKGNWKLRKGVEIQWDHLIAVNYLGLTTDGNMCPICKDCNQLKNGRSLFEFQEALLKQGRSYLTAKGFKKFHQNFSQSYRASFSRLYSIALSLAKREAEENEIRPYIGEFLNAMVERHGRSFPAIRVSSRENFWETSPSRLHFEGLRERFNTDATSGQRTALGVIQKITDELYISGDIQSPDPLESLESFAMIAEKAFERDSQRVESKESNTIRTAMTKTKAALIALAEQSPNAKFFEYATRLPTYGSYMKHGFALIGMGAEDREIMESLAAKSPSKIVATRLTSRGSLYTQLSSHMTENGISSLKELSQEGFAQFAESYITGDETPPTRSAKLRALDICKPIFQSTGIR